ncbi:hypothetical protein D915_007642 [Fasciola hepatica]|uniref:Uncharacterized protein n=1 Tax=Fasciola hepatica TaxID=6192 RepID=A0A4E0R1U7_FASHE|nr:hypothetical protein D915_007642 [Fasciola hepatica]
MFSSPCLERTTFKNLKGTQFNTKTRKIISRNGVNKIETDMNRCLAVENETVDYCSTVIGEKINQLNKTVIERNKAIRFAIKKNEEFLRSRISSSGK